VNWGPPEKVLITGGREMGGLAAFADGISAGFSELGLRSEIVRPSKLVSRLSELRNRRVLKLLSTTGVLGVPLANRAICIAHTLPLATEQGWCKLLVLVGSFKLCNVFPAARVVAVSDYVAVHLHQLFKIQIASTVGNPLAAPFLESFDTNSYERSYITFVGRLVRCKRVNQLLPSICDLLDENPGLRCQIIGDGPERAALEGSVDGHERIEFVGLQDCSYVREQLRRSKLFVSGAANEGFGIAYLEALSQGCIVAMPATGGGIEIVLQRVGQNIQLLPISLEPRKVLNVLRRALTLQPGPVCLAAYAPREVASAYLSLDRTFFAHCHNS